MRIHRWNEMHKLKGKSFFQIGNFSHHHLFEIKGSASTEKATLFRIDPADEEPISESPVLWPATKSMSSQLCCIMEAPIDALIPANSNATSFIVGLFLPIKFKHLFASIATVIISSSLTWELEHQGHQTNGSLSLLRENIPLNFYLLHCQLNE